MRLSVVIVTCNRCDALRSTLDHLAENAALPHGEMEVIVVDNGSTDGTRDAAHRKDIDVKLIARTHNEGVSARNHGFAIARGDFIMLIDDDSYPIGDAAVRSMAYLEQHADVGALVGRVTLPDGRLEASALPSVIANGAVVLRKTVIDQVGGFPTDFLRQAEEYDLSFRIWNAGWRVERFEDVEYRHEKVSGNRGSALIHRLDMRNNLVVVDRYLPAPWHDEIRKDWILRYTALARQAGCLSAARAGRFAAYVRGWRDLLTQRTRLSVAAVEAVFSFDAQARSIAAWAQQHDCRRVVIADFSKNLYSAWSGCRRAGLEVIAIVDSHPAFLGLKYRGLRVYGDAQATALKPDGVVLSNVNPAQVEDRSRLLSASFGCPVLALWQPRFLNSSPRQDERQSSGLFRSDAA